MKTYKGLNKSMSEPGIKYEIGKEYTIEGDEANRNAFYACTSPLECLTLDRPSVVQFYETEQDGVIGEVDNTTIISSKKIKINKKLSCQEIAEETMRYMANATNTTIESDKANEILLSRKESEAVSSMGDRGVSFATEYEATAATDDYGISVTMGNCSASASGGVCGVALSTGYKSASSTYGIQGVSIAAGRRSIATTTGLKSVSVLTDDEGISSANGHNSISATTGEYMFSESIGNNGISAMTGSRGVSTARGRHGVSVTTGSHCEVIADNPSSIAVSWGNKGKAKGTLGSYLVLSEWRWDEFGHELEPYVKMVKVNGKTIKENTFYTMIDGKVKEVKEK